ncbi:hypothetical protein [Paracoccus sediminicola]|uniref:hypothetical protein n=1 Tax=Paracoccus sediminicola TaxID=3017783 RepID=UPI0022F02BBA|nr:hypothetical protein [Paracoccus sediminicola]WBU56724.1 hypothetical protein PAF18_14820 [Paracoccus sediminicola]
MSRVLRFEDFAAAETSAPADADAATLAAEYARGHADGLAVGREGQVEDLISALRMAATQAQEQAEMREQAISETLEAVTPVLKAVTALLCAKPSALIVETVIGELQRLCRAGIPATCQIAGPVELIESLRRRIDLLGLEGIRLIPGEINEITFEHGRIAIDPNEITQRLDRLLGEASTDEER